MTGLARMQGSGNVKRPYLVRWGGVGWDIRIIGNPNNTIEIHETKVDAVESAADMARSTNRAGVFVERKDGTFDRFIPTESVWKRLWEMNSR